MDALLGSEYSLLLAGMRVVLGRDARFEVVAETSSAAELVPLALEVRPEVLVVGARLLADESVLSIPAILQALPGAHVVVVISEPREPAEIEELFRAGASGVVLESIDPRDLAPAVIQAVTATAFHARGLVGNGCRASSTRKELTPRERDVLTGVAGAHSNRWVAERLGLSEATVKFHLSAIYKKLGVHNRTEAATWAVAHGLVDPVTPSV
jgi:DNA-binding NarL/FixJ family response regulator